MPPTRLAFDELRIGFQITITIGILFTLYSDLKLLNYATPRKQKPKLNWHTHIKKGDERSLQ